MKLKSLYLIGALLCASFLPLMLLPGCGSTPEATATHIAGAQVSAVDAALQAWGEWVRAGNATQAQKDAVKSAYDKYFAVATAEKHALEAYVSAKAEDTNADGSTYAAALAVAKAAQFDLLNLITTFKGK